MMIHKSAWDEEELMRKLHRWVNGSSTKEQEAAGKCYAEEIEDGYKTPKVCVQDPVCPPPPRKTQVQRPRSGAPANGYFASPELDVFFKQLDITAKR